MSSDRDQQALPIAHIQLLPRTRDEHQLVIISAVVVRRRDDRQTQTP
jgi:hypothetical protein